MTAPRPVAAGPVSRRPAYADPRLLALVGAGGALGTAARALLEGRFAPPAGQCPWATLVINVTGSFLLGLLLEGLARSGADRGWRRAARLGAGTGFLGGYTTYSAFAVEAIRLAGPAAAAYALASPLLGMTGAAAGLLLARWLTAPRSSAVWP